jgi:TonB family protein
MNFRCNIQGVGMKIRTTFLFLILFSFVASLVFGQQINSGENPEKKAIISPVIGNKISLDIKGMDVIDVLKILATRSGMNMAIGKNVSGKVTLFLKDVDIQDAFDIVLSANDLAYDKKGDIFNIMSQRDYEAIYGKRYLDKTQVKVIRLKFAKAIDLSRALTQIKSNLGKIVVDDASNTLALIDSRDKVREMEDFIKKTDLPLESRVFGLNYAQADKFSAKLQEVITKGVGSIRVDERTNKIFVTDYPAKLDQIAKIVHEFDEKTPQVLIDAQILEIKPSDSLEMGVDWDFWIQKYFEIRTSLPISELNRMVVGTVQATTPTAPGKSKAVLDILRTIGEVNVLSSPRVIALNNQEAKIHVGVRDAYITSTTSQGGSGNTVTAQSVNFVDTGIQLSVTPSINRDGFVTMNIKPEISDSTRVDITSEGQVTQVPIVSTSEAGTTVMVKDGVTIIIGGLRKDKREKTVKKIPLLGDLPGIGFLARSTSDSVTKTDLVILLTPHIISGEHSFIGFSELPPKDGAVAKMVNGKIVVDKLSTNIVTDKTIAATAPKDINYAYYKSIVEKVSLNLDSKKGLFKGTVDITFTLDSGGNIRSGPSVTSSSNPSLNTIALECVRKAAPFAAFPEELQKSQEVFHVTLEYK